MKEEARAVAGRRKMWDTDAMDRLPTAPIRRTGLRWAQFFYWGVFVVGALHTAWNAKDKTDLTIAVLLAAVSFPLAFVLMWLIGLVSQKVPDDWAAQYLRDRRRRPKTIWAKRSRP